MRDVRCEMRDVMLLFLIFSYLVKFDVYLLHKTPNKQTCLSVCLSVCL